MKKNSFIFFVFLFYITHYSDAVSIVSGTISGAPVNAKVYLYEYFGTFFYKVDSAIVQKEGKFKIERSTPLPRGFYQLGENEKNSHIFILGNESPVIYTRWDNFQEVFEISNSVEHTLYSKFLIYNREISNLETKAKELTATAISQEEANLIYKKYQSVYDSLQKAQSEFKRYVTTSYPNSFFGKVLNMFNIDDKAPKENFFKPKEYLDEEYTRGDMLLNKIAFYLQKYAGNDNELWKAEATDLIKNCPAKNKNKELFYINIIQIFVQSGLDIPNHLKNKLTEEFKNSSRTKHFLSMLPRGEPKEGEVAPDIVLADTNGRVVALSSLKGKVVLIDFWASWCGPCRMENPNVVRIYNAYKDRGFTIFSVSLDNSKTNWIKAIAYDKLTWPWHVSDLKGWQSEAASLYQVRGIPATFLIDVNGKIIAKNLRGPSLEKKLAELFP